MKTMVVSAGDHWVKLNVFVVLIFNCLKSWLCQNICILHSYYNSLVILKTAYEIEYSF